MDTVLVVFYKLKSLWNTAFFLLPSIYVNGSYEKNGMTAIRSTAGNTQAVGKTAVTETVGGTGNYGDRGY